jgi:Domain of Unknown Function (DUF928)
MRSLTVFFLSGLLLSMGLFGPAMMPAVADQPAVSQSGPTDNAPLPLYQPPRKLTPRARVGGGLRGMDGSDPVIEALVPDHVGLTVKKTPVLNWFLSKPTIYPTKFTLVNVGSVTPLHEGLIPTPAHAGIQSINLKDWGLVLEPDVQYRWFISLVRDPDSPSKDIVAGGMIERCEFNDCLMLKPILTCDGQQSVTGNAASGFWYDAMACLCELIDTNPSDQSLRRHRAALLNQIGLFGVAEWDLRSIQSPAK